MNRRIVTAGLAVVAALVLSASAAFAARGHVHSAKSHRSVAAADLQRQVADLGAQVKALTKQVTTLKKQLTQQGGWISSIYDQETCISTLSADAFENTWLLIDKLAQPTLGTTFFGGISPVDDHSVCGRFKINRSLLRTPPDLGGIQAMINWLQG